jgi:hypothetical protein
MSDWEIKVEGDEASAKRLAGYMGAELDAKDNATEAELEGGWLLRSWPNHIRPGGVSFRPGTPEPRQPRESEAADSARA